MSDIITRIEQYIGRKFSLRLGEKLLLDAREEIIELRKEKKKILDDVIKTIEDFKPYSPYIVGRMKIEERKLELIEQIKALD